jgi:hypothetical protein
MSRHDTRAPAERSAVTVAEPINPDPPVMRIWVSWRWRERSMVGKEEGVAQFGWIMLAKQKCSTMGVRSEVSECRCTGWLCPAPYL